MKHPISVICLLLALFLPAAPAHAQDDIVEKTYCTQGIAYESIDTLKLDLLNNAKKAVINELFGEFIVASTAVENFVVTKDQIQTSSIGFVRVEGNTNFHNGKDFADVCVTIRAYVTAEDREKFEPEKLEKKYCDADDNLTTAQLIAYVKDEAVIKALIEYNPKLNGANKDKLLQLVQKVTYLEGNFISDTQTYCSTFEGEVIPVEVMAFLAIDTSTTDLDVKLGERIDVRENLIDLTGTWTLQADAYQQITSSGRISSADTKRTILVRLESNGGNLSGEYTGGTGNTCTEVDLNGKIIDNQVSWQVRFTGDCCRDAEVTFVGTVDQETMTIVGAYEPVGRPPHSACTLSWGNFSAVKE